MAHDLATNLEPRPAADPHLDPARRDGSGGADTTMSVGRPGVFTDAEQARTVVSSCRRLLARHVDAASLSDGMVVVVAAKVLDETDGAGCRFVPIDGSPRISAGHFDSLVRDARRALGDAAGRDLDAEVDLPELVAHEVLRRLGPFSVLETADEPDGPDIVQALFVEALACTPSSADDASRTMRGFAEVLRRRAPARPDQASELRAVAAAAVGALDDATTESHRDLLDDAVVDLRDPATSGARGSRS